MKLELLTPDEACIAGLNDPATSPEPMRVMINPDGSRRVFLRAMVSTSSKDVFAWFEVIEDE